MKQTDKVAPAQTGFMTEGRQIGEMTHDHFQKPILSPATSTSDPRADAGGVLVGARKLLGLSLARKHTRVTPTGWL